MIWAGIKNTALAAPGEPNADTFLQQNKHFPSPSPSLESVKQGAQQKQSVGFCSSEPKSRLMP